MSEIIKNIPFTIDIGQLEKELMLNNQDDKKKLRAMVGEAEEIALPQAIYRESYLKKKTDNYLIIGNYKFESKILCRNIGSHNRVFLYAVTVGNELDQWAGEKEELLESYWAGQIQEKVLKTAVSYLYNILNKLIGSECSSEMNPGSLPDWPITEQEKLFALLGNVEGDIGLKLTDSFLMLPAKSVSGIKFPSETDFKNCQLCQRENCPTRRVPYDPEKLTDILH
ncbi:MAG: vitamin B12 dependent methionine synthase [Firmicutes bacterium]|nr:vitamin B12 dependent methionine synthase [Bacillota bacterium]